MHMAWVNVVTGRLKSDYQYSVKLVYNNYPWPTPTDPQRAAVEAGARRVLDTRTPLLESGASFADLYDPLAMPASLLKAHQALDRVVDNCYRGIPFSNDRERVLHLFARFDALKQPLKLK